MPVLPISNPQIVCAVIPGHVKIKNKVGFTVFFGILKLMEFQTLGSNI